MCPTSLREQRRGGGWLHPRCEVGVSPENTHVVSHVRHTWAEMWGHMRAGDGSGHGCAPHLCASNAGGWG